MESTSQIIEDAAPNNSRRRFGVFAATLVVLALFAALLVGRMPSTKTQTNTPTIDTTLIELEAFLMAQSPSSAGALANTSSPQHRAMVWLSEDPGYPYYTDQVKIQRWVLASFYYSTDGGSWIDKAGWMDPDECTWKGISCSGDGFVEALDLDDNGLSGPLVGELGLLGNSLVEIHLNSNDLTGNGFPAEFYQLNKLVTLSLDDNRLEGTIPAAIGNMTALEYLSLKDNYKEDDQGSIISDGFSGALTSELGRCVSLVYLYLQNNSFESSIPSTLGNLVNLKDLELDTNYFFGLVPTELGLLSSLDSLALSDNYLKGELPTEIGSFDWLRKFNASANYLSGSLPTELGNLTSLEMLDLSDNELSSTLPTEVGTMTSLTELYLQQNWLKDENITDDTVDDTISYGIWGQLPTELGLLANLVDFYLSLNWVSGTLPSEMGNMTALKELYLDDNMLTGTIPPEIGNCLLLEKFNINLNDINDTVPTGICDLRSRELVWLEVDACKVVCDCCDEYSCS